MRIIRKLSKMSHEFKYQALMHEHENAIPICTEYVNYSNENIRQNHVYLQFALSRYKTSSSLSAITIGFDITVPMRKCTNKISMKLTRVYLSKHSISKWTSKSKCAQYSLCGPVHAKPFESMLCCYHVDCFFFFWKFGQHNDTNTSVCLCVRTLDRYQCCENANDADVFVKCKYLDLKKSNKHLNTLLGTDFKHRWDNIKTLFQIKIKSIQHFARTGNSINCIPFRITRTNVFMSVPFFFFFHFSHQYHFIVFIVVVVDLFNIKRW